MKKPARLNKGDSIYVPVPASPVKREFFEPGVESLRNRGFRVLHGDVYRKWRYLAGSDEERETDLLNALQDPSVSALFFARGGYGSARLLTQATRWPKKPQPKVLLGCSDLTSLLLYFVQVHGWTAFHGPMASGDFARNQVHWESLELATMQSSPYVLQPKVETLMDGVAEGTLIGGCLSILEASIGTPWEPDFQDSILFLEDVAIKPYQIDRILTHWKILGKLQQVNAFVFGEMKDCFQVENQGYTIQEVLLDLLQDLGKPVYFGFPSGHVSGLNWTVPLGVRARVSATPSFQLEILEGAVE